MILHIYLHWLIWPGTSRRPGENRSGQLGQDELLVTEVGGRLVANLFAFAASSRVIGWKTFKGRGVVYILLFCHLHIYLQGTITNANCVCIKNSANKGRLFCFTETRYQNEGEGLSTKVRVWKKTSEQCR